MFRSSTGLGEYYSTFIRLTTQHSQHVLVMVNGLNFLAAEVNDVLALKVLSPAKIRIAVVNTDECNKFYPTCLSVSNTDPKAAAPPAARQADTRFVRYEQYL